MFRRVPNAFRQSNMGKRSLNEQLAARLGLDSDGEQASRGGFPGSLRALLPFQREGNIEY